MENINWSLYNIPNYDMTDLRKSRELAYNTQADVAEQWEKAIRERKEKMEEQAKAEKLMQSFGQNAPKLAGLLAAL